MNLYSNGQAQIKRRGRHNHSARLKIFKSGPKLSLKMLLSTKNTVEKTEETTASSFFLAKSLLLNIQEFPELDFKLLVA